MTISKNDRNLYLERLQDIVKKECIPTDYCWSGYVQTMEDFEKNNFLILYEGSKRCIVCSDENAVALADYIANYLTESQVITDMTGIFSPGFDQWFFLAWEQYCRCKDELPDWVQDIFEILISANIIQMIRVNDIVYYFIEDVGALINDGISATIENEMEEKCKIRVFEYWEDEFKTEGEICEPECGEWGLNLYNQFMEEHDEVEINAVCSSEIGPSIKFGIEQTVKDISEEDIDWIYEGIAEYISENWNEFEAIAEGTKDQCKQYFADNQRNSLSEAEVESVVKKNIAERMGNYTITFYTDREDVEIDYKLDNADISDAIYKSVGDNFAVVYCVLQDLQKKEVK